MTHRSAEQELYEQWRDDYALMYEPNYDEHLEADCKSAFVAGMKATAPQPPAAAPAAAPTQPGWCDGCSPDNCCGCGIATDYSSPHTIKVVQPLQENSHE